MDIVKSYYAPNELKYTSHQCYFLLCHYELLEQGRYPKDPEHFEAPDGTRGSLRVPVNLALNIKADLDMRLERCGTHGKLLKAECQAQYTYNQLSYESRSALSYISGVRMRKQKYVVFRKQYNYLMKQTEKSAKKIEILTIDNQKNQIYHKI
jgi:hypothetical protein